MKTCIFIFRRDLRIIDNKGLIFALNNYDKVIPVFIFTPEQNKNNQYKSANAVQFMVECLRDLDKYLSKCKSKLHLFYGDNISVLKRIYKELKFQAVIFNQDYTPYAIKRDSDIGEFCKERNINYHTVEDYLLHPMGSIRTNAGTIYTVYTSFKDKGLTLSVAKPIKNAKWANLSKYKFSFSANYPAISENKKIASHGGRPLALGLLARAAKMRNYAQTRNMVDIPTTELSAYIKFGCVSIREVYWKLLNIETLVAQLYWREFYYYIAHYFPRVLKGENFNGKHIKWNNINSNFSKWTKGETGFPIVDAGMRELNITGNMHNRARLITANFLNRMLGFHWKYGEKYFASKLTDYDPSVNNGNWQWIASVGVDTKPYNQRLFNPWLQSKKFDPDAKYIKKWLPSLANVPAGDLHEWDKKCGSYNLKKMNYFKPIVNYEIARKESLKVYKNAL